jgi:ABC-2 type transport system permease protein
VTAFRPFLVNETRLYLREPWIAGLTLLLPVVLFLALGLPASSQVADPGIGGHRQIDTALPSLSLGLSLTMLGLFSVPTFLATYRETGLLRRLAITPVSPSTVLTAQLVISTVTALIAVVTVLLLGWFVVGMAFPTSASGLVAAIALGTVATFGVGLVIAAVAGTAKAASGMAFAVMVPSFFLGGVYVPRQFLPGWVQTIGDATPLGALRRAIEIAQTGDGRLWLPLVILAAWSVATIGVARWTFRWQ